MIDLSTETFVPISIDAAREVDGIDMYRAAYLIVTTDAPGAVWEIELPLAPIQGLGAMGLLGVVVGTLRDSPNGESRLDIFTDPGDVASVFALEDRGELSIQLEDVWVPTKWCESVPDWGTGEPDSEPVVRGDIFRIGPSLFRQLYRYATGDIAVDTLMDSDHRQAVYRSPRETAAFRYWADAQIEQSKQSFDRAPENLKLRWE